MAALLAASGPALYEASHSTSLELRCFPFCVNKSITQTTQQNHRIPTETNVTGWPARWTRGQTITISGNVVSRESGAPVPGTTVDIYLNNSKSQPGTLLGTATTNGDGVWTYSGTAPSDVRPQSYSIVAHATGSGAYLPSWSDPSTSVYANTHLSVSVEFRDRGWLVGLALADDAGNAVPNATVVATYAGTSTSTVLGPNGEGQMAIQGTPPLNVTFSFGGSGYDNPTRVNVTLTAPPIAVAATGPVVEMDGGTVVYVPLGGTAEVSGTTAPGLSVAFGPTSGSGGPNAGTVVADQTGHFTILLHGAQAPGSESLEIRASSATIPLSLISGRVATVTVRVAPGLWAATINVHAAIGSAPWTGAPLHLAVRGPTNVTMNVTTDASGNAAIRIPLSSGGTYTFTAVPADPAVLPVPVSAEAYVFDVADFGVPMLAALLAMASFAMLPWARAWLRPRAALAIQVDGVAVTDVPLEAKLDLKGGSGRVCVEAWSEPEAELGRATKPVARLVRALGRTLVPRWGRPHAPRSFAVRTAWVEGAATLPLVFEVPGLYTVQAHVHPTAGRRGRAVRATVRVQSRAEALAEGDRADEVDRLRWGPRDAGADVIGGPSLGA
jgi:hypothetical protein